MLIAGNITAVFAVIFGIYDLSKINNSSSLAKVELHVTFVLVSYLLYGTVLWLKIQNLDMMVQSRAEILFSLWGLTTLLVGAYHGGSLVYECKVCESAKD